MEVIDYINQLKKEIKHEPQCAMVFLMLRLNFKDAEPFYNSDHIITRIGDRFYDWSGEVFVSNHIPFEDNYGSNWVVNHYNSIIS